jgi:methionine-rich copper-binding protein CopC
MNKRGKRIAPLVVLVVGALLLGSVSSAWASRQIRPISTQPRSGKTVTATPESVVANVEGAVQTATALAAAYYAATAYYAQQAAAAAEEDSEILVVSTVTLGISARDVNRPWLTPDQRAALAHQHFD